MKKNNLFLFFILTSITIRSGVIWAGPDEVEFIGRVELKSKKYPLTLTHTNPVTFRNYEYQHGDLLKITIGQHCYLADPYIPFCGGNSGYYLHICKVDSPKAKKCSFPNGSRARWKDLLKLYIPKTDPRIDNYFATTETKQYYNYEFKWDKNVILKSKFIRKEVKNTSKTAGVNSLGEPIYASFKPKRYRYYSRSSYRERKTFYFYDEYPKLFGVIKEVPGREVVDDVYMTRNFHWGTLDEDQIHLAKRYARYFEAIERSRMKRKSKK